MNTKSWRHGTVLVDTDMAWKLQGRIGRTAQEMLD